MSAPTLDNNIQQISPPGGAPISGKSSPVTIPASPNLNTDNGQRTVYHIDEATISAIQTKLNDEIDGTNSHIGCIQKLINQDDLQRFNWKMRSIFLPVSLLVVITAIVTLATGPFGLLGLLVAAGTYYAVKRLDERLHSSKRTEHQRIRNDLIAHRGNLNKKLETVCDAKHLWNHNLKSYSHGPFRKYLQNENQRLSQNRPLTLDNLTRLTENFRTRLDNEILQGLDKKMLAEEAEKKVNFPGYLEKAEMAKKENPVSTEVGNFQTYLETFKDHELTDERLVCLHICFKDHLRIEEKERELSKAQSELQASLAQNPQFPKNYMMAMAVYMAIGMQGGSIANNAQGEAFNKHSTILSVIDRLQYEINEDRKDVKKYEAELHQGSQSCFPWIMQ